jgi:N6-L-threonylcarbamoyladenine synthase
MLILAIETSCDDTAVALYNTAHGLIAHEIYSQIPLTELFGGVVPELAARDHSAKIIPLIKLLLKKNNKTLQDLQGIAYTSGPGLIGAILVGAAVGRSLAYALNIPAIGVHHMEAHLLAPMLEVDKPDFPFLALLVSGGHTQLVNVQAMSHYQVLGESLDDAVGEAFDKTAKLLGLGYPGGPAISALAKKGNAERFTFPRPMINRPGLDFSFSGLKTYVRNAWENSDGSEQTKADIARAFEEAAVATLVIKCKRALEVTQLKTLVVAGGVSANQRLRTVLNDVAAQQGIKIFFPRIEFSTDNAAMVAYAGAQRLLRGEKASLEIKVQPRWALEELRTFDSAIKV